MTSIIKPEIYVKIGIIIFMLCGSISIVVAPMILQILMQEGDKGLSNPILYIPQWTLPFTAIGAILVIFGIFKGAYPI